MSERVDMQLSGEARWVRDCLIQPHGAKRQKGATQAKGGGVGHGVPYAAGSGLVADGSRREFVNGCTGVCNSTRCSREGVGVSGTEEGYGRSQPARQTQTRQLDRHRHSLQPQHCTRVGLTHMLPLRAWKPSCGGCCQRGCAISSARCSAPALACGSGESLTKICRSSCAGAFHSLEWWRWWR